MAFDPIVAPGDHRCDGHVFRHRLRQGKSSQSLLGTGRARTRSSGNRLGQQSRDVRDAVATVWKRPADGSGGARNGTWAGPTLGEPPPPGTWGDGGVSSYQSADM